MDIHTHKALSKQEFLPIDTPCTIHTQYDLDTDMEDGTGPVQSKTNTEKDTYEAQEVLLFCSKRGL